MEIAAEHSERERQRARIGVEERLLLDRIDLQRGDVAARHAQHAVLVVADLADALEAVEDLAAMAARVAAHRFVLQLVDELRSGHGRSVGEGVTSVI